MTDKPTSDEQQSSHPDHKEFTPTIVSTDLKDLIKEHLGEVFLVVNPEAFQETGLGHTIEPGWGKAKLIGVGADYLITLGEYSHGTGKHAKKELMKQFIPFSHIKRVTFMKSERLIHV